ncbi:hypothetical protein ACHAWF_001973 [Thalassiosira exigua]
MCRCPSGSLAVPGRFSADGRDAGVVQPPSRATGTEYSKRFVVHPPEEEGTAGCDCVPDHPAAELTTDAFLSRMRLRPTEQCPRSPQHAFEYEWDAMPDFGVEEKLPLFVGVLSFESPLSLNRSLHDWREHGLFEKVHARDVFVQLNHKGPGDDEVADAFQATLKRDDEPPLTVMGSPTENLHPGLAISKFCRAAEAGPNSHPNGENLLLFLEKDWNLYAGGPNDEPEDLEVVFDSINSLVQRGVPYVRLSVPVNQGSGLWRCPSRGVAWTCTNAHQHRWTNTPSVISCSWFLRYLEPFALLDDPIMYGCRKGMQETRYCDWEEALQDGRVAWTNGQWIVASKAVGRPRTFVHHEVDG